MYNQEKKNCRNFHSLAHYILDTKNRLTHITTNKKKKQNVKETCRTSSGRPLEHTKLVAVKI